MNQEEYMLRMSCVREAIERLGPKAPVEKVIAEAKKLYEFVRPR